MINLRGIIDTLRGRNSEVLFAKVREDAIIPSKDLENGGYDIYANFSDDEVTIRPQTVLLIPTGICSAFHPKFVSILKERGSTGTKCMAIRAGVIDSGYRGEWFVPINNTTNKPITISKHVRDTVVTDEEIIYPYSKAICQAVFQKVPKLKVKEISLEELKAIPSKRGSGMLGSSGK